MAKSDKIIAVKIQEELEGRCEECNGLKGKHKLSCSQLFLQDYYARMMLYNSITGEKNENTDN
jgi:hypothetical protein